MWQNMMFFGFGLISGVLFLAVMCALIVGSRCEQPLEVNDKD